MPCRPALNRSVRPRTSLLAYAGRINARFPLSAPGFGTLCRTLQRHSPPGTAPLGIKALTATPTEKLTFAIGPISLRSPTATRLIEATAGSSFRVRYLPPGSLFLDGSACSPTGMLGRNMASGAPVRSLHCSPVPLLTAPAQRSEARRWASPVDAGCSERPFTRPQRPIPFRNPPR